MNWTKVGFIFLFTRFLKIRTLSDDAQPSRTTPDTLVKMISYGIKHIVINVHHLSEIIIQYIEKKNYPAQILISYEEELLDTSGGLFKASAIKSIA